MSGLKGVVGLSFASVVGLTLLVLSCALPAFGSWWPMFVIIFYVLAPLPVMISRNIYECDINTASPCVEFAFFATTTVVFSAFALPFILAHAGAIHWGAFALTTFASLVIFGTIFHWFRESEDEYSSAMF